MEIKEFCFVDEIDTLRMELKQLKSEHDTLSQKLNGFMGRIGSELDKVNITLVNINNEFKDARHVREIKETKNEQTLKQIIDWKNQINGFLIKVSIGIVTAIILGVGSMIIYGKYQSLRVEQIISKYFKVERLTPR